MFRGIAGLVLVALFGNLTVNGPALGEDKKAEPAADSKSAQAAEDLVAAYRMVDLARAKKSPEAMIFAARIIGTTPTRKPLAEEKFPEGATAVDGLKVSGELLAEAQKMEGSNELTMKLAEAAKKEIASAERFVLGGPINQTCTISKVDRRDTYVRRCSGYTVVNVANLSGQGDIDLQAEDDNGRVLDHDHRFNQGARISFTTPPNTQVIIYVKYASGAGNLFYRITSN